MRWAVLQFCEFTEPLNTADVLRDLRRHLPDAEIKFPGDLQGEIAPDDPLSSYAFLRADALTDAQVLRAERSRYVSNVLCVPASKRPSYIESHEVRRMMTRPRGQTFSKGQDVQMVGGDWIGLRGVVYRVVGDVAVVEVDLWSSKKFVHVEFDDLRLCSGQGV